ncbi:MAG: putative repeat protein (TIGR01451 family), partial [Myxococcota bacterium]
MLILVRPLAPMLVLLALCSDSAHGSVALDDTQGSFTVTLNDGVGVGVIPTEVAVGTLGLALVDGVDVSEVTTISIAPAANGGWRYIDVSLWRGDIDTAVLLDGAGAVIGNPLVPAFAAPNGVTRRFDLTGLTLPAEIAVRLTLRRAPTGLSPILAKIHVSWTPRAGFAGVLRSPEAPCTGGLVSLEATLAAAHTTATGVVAWLDAPTSDDGLIAQFTQASGGGIYRRAGLGPIAIDGIIVPDAAVYWRVTALPTGSAQRFTAQFRIPDHQADGTLFRTVFAAAADNVEQPFSSGVDIPAVARPKFYLEGYVTGGINVPNSSVIGWAPGGRIDSRGFYGNWAQGAPPSCGGTMFDAVYIEDISGLVDPDPDGTDANYPGGPAIVAPPAGLAIHGDGTYYAVETDVGGVTAPAGSVVWELGDLEPGVWGSLNLGMTLLAAQDDDPPGPVYEGQVLRTRGRLVSRRSGQSATFGRSYTVLLAPPPALNLVVGEAAGSHSSAKPGLDDLATRWATYDEPKRFLLTAENVGHVDLDEVHVVIYVGHLPSWSLEDLPDGVVVRSYADAPHGAPPAFDPDAAEPYGAGWFTGDPGAQNVTWVALALAPVPTDLTDPARRQQLAIAVQTPTPAQSCDQLELTLAPRAYIVEADGAPLTPSLSSTDSETMRIRAALPRVVTTAAGAFDGTARVASFDVDVINRGIGTRPATAYDVTVTLTLPTLDVAGTTGPAPLAGITAPGGFVQYDGLPNTVTVHFDAIGAEESVEINVAVTVPRGTAHGASATLGVAVDARDAECGPVSASTTGRATVSAEPRLTIALQADRAAAAPGDRVVFMTTTLNSGSGSSSGTWVLWPVPTKTTLASVAVPDDVVEVRFAGPLERAIPNPAQPWTDADVLSLFTPGALDGSEWVSPFGGTTRAVAVRIDRNTTARFELEPGTVRSVDFAVTVDSGASGLILAEAAVLSNRTVEAASGRAIVAIGDAASARLALDCPTVVGAGDPFVAGLDYANDAGAALTSLALGLTMPAELSASGHTHVWNSASVARTGTPVWDTSAPPRITTAVVDASDPPLEPLQGGRWEATLTATGAVSQLIQLAADLNAATAAGSVLRNKTCVMLIRSPDLWAIRLVDRHNPKANETVNITLTVGNSGDHTAHEIIIEDTLPEGLDYVVGSAFVISDGYVLAPQTEPTMIGRRLFWSIDGDNALIAAGGEPAVLAPGTSARIGYQLRVAGSAVAGDIFSSCTAVTGRADAVDGRPNESCVAVRAALPDAFVRVALPSVAVPGATIVATVDTGNRGREAVTGIVTVIGVPDGPLPIADGVVDLVLASVVADPGATLWFHAGPADTAPATPAHDDAAMAAAGWSNDLIALSGPASWVAAVRRDVPAHDHPHQVFMSLTMVSAIDGSDVGLGSTFELCARAAVFAGAGDELISNDVDCAIVQTPALDIATVSTCDPMGARPGILPGESIAYEALVENNSASPAYGVRVAVSGWAPSELGALPAAEPDPQPTTFLNAPGALVGLGGTPILGIVTWQRDGDSWILGDADTASDTYYRRVGLGAREAVSLRWSGAVADDLPQGHWLEPTLTARLDHKPDFDPETDASELLLTNNSHRCATRVNRADMAIGKRAEASDGGALELAVAGEIVRYRATYDNLGERAASDAVFEDILPPDAIYIAQSTLGLPAGARVELDDGSGRWDIDETLVEPGANLPTVRAIRVRMDFVDAPPGQAFTQTTVADFQPGDFGENTETYGFQQGVGLSFDRPGVYRSAVFPSDDAGSGLDWESL